jgi:adenine/guanine phosphoribosyltransferase-like PRPP-binding protein
MKNILPEIPFSLLTRDVISDLTPPQIESELAYLISKRGRIRGNGQILAFSEFNEDPDLLVNIMLAKILISKINPSMIVNLKSSNIVVMSIENSAAYLASAVAFELETKYNLDRPPRIIRARKTPDGHPPSPAMGEIQTMASVVPITSNHQPRYLIASIPDSKEIKDTQILVIVDDFKATGDTIRGGIEIGISLLEKCQVSSRTITIIPMAGLGKPDQEQKKLYRYKNAKICSTITALNVKFWPDWKTKKALIQTNNFQPQIMHNASAGNFQKV